jgi:hypothetical protein
VLVALAIGPVAEALPTGPLVVFATGLPVGAFPTELVGVPMELIALFRVLVELPRVLVEASRVLLGLSRVLVGLSTELVVLSSPSPLACTFATNSPSTFPFGE